MRNIFKVVIFALGFIGAFPFTSGAQNREMKIDSLLPERSETGAWHLVDSALVYAGEDLYKLIDGGADIYIEYGFKQVIAAEYQNNQKTSIKLEIYEMTDTASAYGIYSFNVDTNGKTVRIGNGGSLNEYYLLFWKNTYIVFLSSDDTTGGTLEGILTLAESIDKKIPAGGRKPVLCELLPKKDLEADKYVKGFLGLSSVYDFDTRNIFGVREGAIGIYKDYRVFIFKYDSETEAGQIYTKTREYFNKSSRYTGFTEQKDLFTMSDRKGYYLYVMPIGNTIVVIIGEQTTKVMEIFKEVKVK